MAEALVPTHCGYCEPAWSPDGKKIMYYAPDPNNGDKPSVFVIELSINVNFVAVTNSFLFSRLNWKIPRKD